MRCSGPTFAAACLALAVPLVAQSPRPADGQGDDRWWSLRPLATPPIPAGDATHPVDRFLDAARARHGLPPATAADRATWIRRATFDLHGLAPTPAEVDAFVADDRPDAVARAVDRLLASPRYGERQARHWLDVAHYGETHGYDKDKLRAHAWPYRDYVIRAANADKPYARFVAEQIAGDALFADHPDGIVATGFLAAGPWDFVGHSELRDGTTDKAITRHLDRDDFVTTVMTTFASTTAHCAQCHDHKFDPIPQRDYYRLQAVFSGIDRADRPYWTAEELARRRALEAERTRVATRVERFDRKRAAVTSPEIEAIDARLAALAARGPATGWPPVPATRPQTGLGYHSAIAPRGDEAKWIEVDLGAATDVDRIVLIPAWEAFGGHPGPGFGFPRRLRVEVVRTDGSRDVLVDDDVDRPPPGDTPLVVPVPDGPIRAIRVTATRLFERTGDHCFALQEVLALAATTNVALGAAITTGDSIEAGERWGARFAVDGRDSRGPLDAPTLAALLRAAELAAEHDALEARRGAAVDAALGTDAVAAGRADRRALDAIDVELASLAAPHLVYAAATDFAPIGRFRPAESPRPIHVLTRGSVESPGERVGPGALSSLPHLERWFADLGPDSPEAERRAALAHWLTDPDNPLTWRSIVNRIWQQHFGRGLVATPNDFGRMGAEPTHPELLDWLAVWFRDEAQGSWKALHRLLMTSAAYGRASTPSPNALAKDPDNRWLTAMPRRRLEAEAVRDAMLQAAGLLDRTMGGPSARQFVFENDHSPRYLYAELDVADPALHRRSIYRHVVRSVPDPWFEVLDCADPSLSTPRRIETLTPLQALTTWNDRFTFHVARHFAARLRAATDEPGGRVDLAARLVWGRAPDAMDRAAMTGHAERHGLESLCRVLLNTNRFLFVD